MKYILSQDKLGLKSLRDSLNTTIDASNSLLSHSTNGVQTSYRSRYFQSSFIPFSNNAVPYSPQSYNDSFRMSSSFGAFRSFRNNAPFALEMIVSLDHMAVFINNGYILINGQYFKAWSENKRRYIDLTAKGSQLGVNSWWDITLAVYFDMDENDVVILGPFLEKGLGTADRINEQPTSGNYFPFDNIPGDQPALSQDVLFQRVLIRWNNRTIQLFARAAWNTMVCWARLPQLSACGDIRKGVHK